MNTWINEAAFQAKLHAPQLTDEHALDLADDLYRQCAATESTWSPAKAVAWFFAFMPAGWPTAPDPRSLFAK